MTLAALPIAFGQDLALGGSVKGHAGPTRRTINSYNHDHTLLSAAKVPPPAGHKP